LVSDSGIEYRVRDLQDISERVANSIKMRMRIFLEDSDNEQIRTISMSSGDIRHRVKPYSSIIRKVRELGVTKTEEIPGCIEDYIGTRISTPNKHQARELFEFLRKYQSTQDDWLCKISNAPKFVPMTVEDKNNYSISTGYQAYHVTFVYDSERKLGSDCDVCEWPVELQIMAQLWEFWADYSRRYFYRTSSSKQALPYQVAISKILDSADDLMRATAEDILTDSTESVFGQEEQQEDLYHQEREIVDKVGKWMLNENRLKILFGASKLPAPVFLIKIQETCDSFSIDLDDVERFMTEPEYEKRYTSILATSPSVTFLPPYQSMLMFSLMGKGHTDEEIVELINEELWLVGKKLQKPPTPVRKAGIIIRYNPVRKFGIVETDASTFRFFLSSFKDYITPEDTLNLQGAEVTFDVVLENSPKYGCNHIARNIEIINWETQS
jgi:ppGpp synthetase/RelA/SpoT-type nucleotidyltranferase